MKALIVQGYGQDASIGEIDMPHHEGAVRGLGHEAFALEPRGPRAADV